MLLTTSTDASAEVDVSSLRYLGQTPIPKNKNKRICSAISPTGENLLPESTKAQIEVSIKEAITGAISNITESIKSELKNSIQTARKELCNQ